NCLGIGQCIPPVANRRRATVFCHPVSFNFGNPALSYCRAPMNPHLLTLLVFMPLAAAFLMAFIPAAKKTLYKYVALLTGLLQLILSGGMYYLFQPNGAGVTEASSYQF